MIGGIELPSGGSSKGRMSQRKRAVSSSIGAILPQYFVTVKREPSEQQVVTKDPGGLPGGVRPSAGKEPKSRMRVPGRISLTRL